MVSESPMRWVVAVMLVGVSLWFLRVGVHRDYPIQPDPALVAEAKALQSFQPANSSMPPGMLPGLPEMPTPPKLPREAQVKDWQVVENTTFTGIVRERGREVLRFTYDPNDKRGKRSCPT